MKDLFPFADLIISLCQDRQAVKPLNVAYIAQCIITITQRTTDIGRLVEEGKVDMSKTIAYRASKILEEYRGCLAEFFSFYSSYEPSFDWWVTVPYRAANEALADYIKIVRTKLADDDIIGEPVGRQAFLDALDVQMIPYSPEELLDIAREQYNQCEEEMKKASKALGYGNDWREALEQVKTKVVPAGQQTQLVRKLVLEGITYVKQHDLVTVPEIAEKTWRMLMMPVAEKEEVSFFPGGPTIAVASPTKDMDYNHKAMVMRAGNLHFSHAGIFQELIPGHALQLLMAKRNNSHRPLLSYWRFFKNGWTMYLGFVFWERGDFFVGPEDKISAMFGTMHSAASILSTLQFHLGNMSPGECVDFLMKSVGHGRLTAEEEVRRSLAEGCSPLHQASYLLGAQQLWALRKETVDSGRFREKDLHDEVLKSGGMPIELLRAVLLDKELTPDYETKWRFK